MSKSNKEEEVSRLEELKKDNSELFDFHKKGMELMLKQAFDAGVKFGHESALMNKAWALPKGILSEWEAI